MLKKKQSTQTTILGNKNKLKSSQVMIMHKDAESGFTIKARQA